MPKNLLLVFCPVLICLVRAIGTKQAKGAAGTEGKWMLTTFPN
jgi:hypothetical protein